MKQASTFYPNTQYPLSHTKSILYVDKLLCSEHQSVGLSLCAENRTFPGKKVKSLSRVRLFVTPWTVVHQAPPSMEFSRQECWSGLPFPPPGNLPDTGIEPRSPALWADVLLSGKLYISW